MFDYYWGGTDTAITTAVFDVTVDPNTNRAQRSAKLGLNVIGPVALDSISYVYIRTDQVLTPPVNVQSISAAFGNLILGSWAAVPTSCTNFQARAVLLQMPSVTPNAPVGRSLFDDVNDMLKAQGGAAWQAWEFANEFTRNGALVQSMAAALGMADVELDAFFTQSAHISA